jgi:hypothetical protein
MSKYFQMLTLSTGLCMTVVSFTPLNAATDTATATEKECGIDLIKCAQECDTKHGNSRHDYMECMKPCNVQYYQCESPK